MHIEINTDGQTLTLTLIGRLDSSTAPQLEAELKKMLAHHRLLTFNFAQLDYVSSAGLRVLLAAQKIMNRQGRMRLIQVNPAVMEVFDITGFSDILTFE